MDNKNEKESSLQKRFISWLNRNDFLNLKTHGGMAYMKNYANGTYYPITLKAGFSDIMIFEKGQVLFVELKSNVGVLRTEQRENFEKLYKEEFTSNIWIVRPRDFDNLKKNYKISQNMHDALVNTFGENNWIPKKRINSKGIK